MKFFSLQNNLVKIRVVLIKIIYVKLLLFFNLGCGNKLNQTNYNQCIDKLEKERQKIRVGKRFSYKAPSYEECRAPARYKLDSD